MRTCGFSPTTAPTDVEDETLALIYVATVGTFNRKSKDKSSLELFRVTSTTPSPQRGTR